MLQEELRQLRAQKGAGPGSRSGSGSGSGSDDAAMLHAVNAQLAEENALLSSSCADLEMRLAGEGGFSSGSNGPTRDEVRNSLILQILHSLSGMSSSTRDVRG